MIRKLGIAILLLLFVPVGCLGSGAVYEYWNSYTHRYYLTIEVDTPDGIKSGSSVIQVSVREKASWLPQTPGVNNEVIGEAVFVDLGHGRNVIALMNFGPTGKEHRMHDLAPRAFNLYRANWYREAPYWEGSAALSSDLIPTLVTFADLNDPKTARVLQLHEFPQVFGDNFRFQRATIEMTDDAVSRKIRRQLPAMMAALDEQEKTHRLQRVGDPFRLSSGQLKRGW